MDFLDKNAPIGDLIITNQFALSEEFPSIQLSIHFSNLCQTYGTHSALSKMRSLLAQEHSLDTNLLPLYPVIHRCNALLIAYGADTITTYISDVYGSEETASLSQNDTQGEINVEKVR